MGADQRDLLEVLKSELRFLQEGGYRKSSWRPQFIFEDSPSCLNYQDPQRTKACSECVLIQLVPPDKQREKIPCRHIPLNGPGETLDSLYRTGTQEEIESAIKNWLIVTIQALEKERAQLAPVPQATEARKKAV